ncbi:uncharacterized protein LOC122848980 [Aphidius gifuensis]|uniref:uncharacterized protein LOC122848980 n=1 Tax=Aphidius gifuensis TaxID=684658 RepID=UPI001CDCCC0C|nr:uncharacterized protein LOC122848980 [Aphidius gifuensis]
MNPAVFKFDPSPSDDRNENYPCCGYLENGEYYNCNTIPEIEETKIVSEIKETGQPYKEIEVMINNNRIVLRIQKPRQIEEDDSPKQPDQKPRESQYSNFQKVSTYPPSTNSKADRIQKPDDNGPRPIELVANPNIFLLKIRKRSLNSDKKRENIDLEFRIPRPFKPKPPERKKKRKIESPPPPPPEVPEDVAVLEEEEEIPLKKQKKKVTMKKKKKK